MNDTELEKRKARAASETLVISQTDGGFRVYNPANITHIYMVTGIPESPKCNCPDFETHQSDPEWRCKHILAVLGQMEKPKPQAAAEDTHDSKATEITQNENHATEKKKVRAPRNGHSEMTIKRSVSPDGFINSLSIEFSNSTEQKSDEDIKQQAVKALKLQAEIVDGFLKENGNVRPDTEATKQAQGNANAHGNSQRKLDGQSDNPSGAVPAQLLNVAGMNTIGGWKLFINVQVNGRTAKLFGNKKELSEHVAAAGFPSVADHLNQGMALYLPCRVVTKPSPDGKYLNIERVLPKSASQPGKGG